MSPQGRQVAMHTIRHGGITTLEATSLVPPVCRLSERIRELEGEGWVFEHVPVHAQKRRYVQYRPMLWPENAFA